MNFENYNFKNKRAIVRVDFNVPLDNNGVITDDTRIKMAIPTITKIINDGGSVILMSHLGRPDNEPNPKFSLQQILPNLEALLNQKVIFCADCISEEAVRTTSKLKSGDIVLLENLRFYKEEKLGNKDFALKLSKHGDVFINDAFGTAHRFHASTAIIADFFLSRGNFLITLSINMDISLLIKVIYQFLQKLYPVSR